MPARELLQGSLSSKVQRGAARSPMLRWLIGGLAVLAGVAWMAGWWLSGQAAAGAFVGAGMAAVLLSVLQLYRSWTLPSIESRPASAMQTFQNLLAKNVHRNPMRSALAAGLIATASFLLMAISLFHSQADRRGVGGWHWIAESSQPILRDLNDPKVQQQVLGPRRSQLDGVAIVSARLRAGDDASCGNLYQSQQPRVLGMRPEIVDWELQLPAASRFPWAGYDKSGQSASLPSPWSLLERPGDGTVESPLPVILDQNTAMWSLHRGAKIGEVFSFEMEDRPLFFKTVGLLQNTLLQGSLIIGEGNFRKAFPSLSGYQWFLVGGKPPADLDLARQALEEGWSEEGWTAQSTYGVLDQLLAVQNTYLKAFQALGALGLLLGTLGLAVVQVRSVLECFRGRTFVCWRPAWGLEWGVRHWRRSPLCGEGSRLVRCGVRSACLGWCWCAESRLERWRSGRPIDYRFSMPCAASERQQRTEWRSFLHEEAECVDALDR